MKIANIEILKDRWIFFLKDLYQLQGNTSKKFVVERYCKCDGLDIKLVIKMEGNYQFKSDDECTVSFQITLSTDCTSLRRSNYFWSDKETFTITRCIESQETMTFHFENIVNEIMEKIDYFKICKYCRILYQEQKEEDPKDSVCLHCRFDSIFYVKDINCVICNETLLPEDQSFTLTCGHTYHSNCILLHFIKTSKRECPLCREPDSHQI